MDIKIRIEPQNMSRTKYIVFPYTQLECSVRSNTK